MLPTKENGLRNPNGTLVSTTRPTAVPIRPDKITNGIEVERPRKPWPHRRNVREAIIVTGIVIGAILAFFLTRPVIEGFKAAEITGWGTLLAFLIFVLFMIGFGVLFDAISRALRNKFQYKVDPDAPTT